ncbi:MAG: cryptochrome/photolyase family protein [Chitinophagaceae bacterium]
MTISLIFPHQLFHQHPAIKENEPVYLIEEELFFKQFKFHKQKIILHKASMFAYASSLRAEGFEVKYIAAHEGQSNLEKLFSHLKAIGTKQIRSCFPSDEWLKKHVDTAAQKNSIKVQWIEGPDFLTSRDEINTFFKGKKHYHQTDFYIYQRKKLGILLNDNGSPIGGKWTYDAENRKKLPKQINIPQPVFPQADEHLKKALEDVIAHYPDLPGDATFKNNIFPWAWTRQQALNNLAAFLHHRFSQFGEYEDAIARDEHFIFHSLLSPSINIGLITPKEIIDTALAFAEKHNVPLNATEGFIRQIIGWREYMRATYLLNGGYQRTRNYWGFKRKIPSTFYTGTTGIEPIDQTIKKVLQTGYAHHIERLMILGNFFLLCEFDPDEVYKWFMELFIDAYDWVMVPNVYSMTQFADGGTITTKPYISGSNYLFKMSDYKKEKVVSHNTWHYIWDSLFWHFMDKQRSFLLSNPRLGMLVHTFDKMPDQKQKDHIECAKAFLKKLDTELETVT